MAVPGSVEDVKSKRFWKACFAELLGTGLLVLVACGSGINPEAPDLHQRTDSSVRVRCLHIALCFAFSVASIVWMIGNVSGGHINPGVTTGFIVTRKISLLRGLFYIIFQSIGAILGAGILKVLVASKVTAKGLGNCNLENDTTAGQGFGIELLITFVLVFTVMAAVDEGRTDIAGSIPLTIGVAIGMCHLWAIPFTGSGMNPARVLGPDVIHGPFSEEHWIYWVGPLLGGAIAGLLYDLVFAVNASPAKLKGFFTSKDYDDSHYDKCGKRNTIAIATELKP